MMSPNHFERFYTLGKDIIEHPLYQSQKDFVHHTHTLFDHAVYVAYYSYRLAYKWGLNETAVVRGALLHDFFLYDWRLDGKKIKKRGFKKHGFVHARIALKNAKAHFDISDLEEDIILKHMFPLNIKPPKHKESWLVNLVDSWITLREYYKKPINVALLTYLEEKNRTTQSS